MPTFLVYQHTELTDADGVPMVDTWALPGLTPADAAVLRRLADCEGRRYASKKADRRRALALIRRVAVSSHRRLSVPEMFALRRQGYDDFVISCLPHIA